MSSSWEMGEHFPKASAGTIPTAPELIAIWVPCGWCGGQRQFFTRTAEGHVPQVCTACGGMGETMRLVDR